MLWDDLNARARGLSTHLLSRAEIEALAAADDLPGLAGALAKLGALPASSIGAAGTGAAAALELALRRRAAAPLSILGRWCRQRRPALALTFEDETRRSLRALVRGAVAGTPADRRLAGLVPTPDLPERALRELARQPSAAALAELLTVWGNPYGAAIGAEARRPYPDLFRLETALNRCFAARTAEALQGGGRELAAYVRESIDLENAATAQLLAAGAGDVPPEILFLPGGRRLSRRVFAAIAACGSAPEAARRLAALFRGTPFAPLFARRGEGHAIPETEMLAVRLRQQTADARRRPLGPAPLLAFLLRLRAEMVDLRRLVWGIALGVPRVRLVEGLVTP